MTNLPSMLVPRIEAVLSFLLCICPAPWLASIKLLFSPNDRLKVKCVPRSSLLQFHKCFQYLDTRPHLLPSPNATLTSKLDCMSLRLNASSKPSLSYRSFRKPILNFLYCKLHFLSKTESQSICNYIKFVKARKWSPAYWVYSHLMSVPYFWRIPRIINTTLCEHSNRTVRTATGELQPILPGAPIHFVNWACKRIIKNRISLVWLNLFSNNDLFLNDKLAKLLSCQMMRMRESNQIEGEPI